MGGWTIHCLEALEDGGSVIYQGLWTPVAAGQGKEADCPLEPLESNFNPTKPAFCIRHYICVALNHCDLQCQKKKKKHNLKVKNYVLFSEFSEYLSPEDRLLDNSDRLLLRGKAGTRIHRFI